MAGGTSVDVIVDHRVLLGVDDDAVMMTVADGGRRHGRQCLVRGRGRGGRRSGSGVMVVVVASRGHQRHGAAGRRVPAAAGLVGSQRHPVAAVRTGATGARAVRPARRLQFVVVIERFGRVYAAAAATVLLGRVHTRRHGRRRHHGVDNVMMMRVMVAAARAPDQRLRGILRKSDNCAV